MRHGPAEGSPYSGIGNPHNCCEGVRSSHFRCQTLRPLPPLQWEWWRGMDVDRLGVYVSSYGYSSDRQPGVRSMATLLYSDIPTRQEIMLRSKRHDVDQVPCRVTNDPSSSKHRSQQLQIIDALFCCSESLRTPRNRRRLLPFGSLPIQ